MTRAAGVRFVYRSDLRRGRSLATVGGGVAAADVDGDGFVDLFFTGTVRNGKKPEKGPRSVLYRNRGDGTFQDVTEPSGIHETGWIMGAHFADLDADGLPDLLLTASGGNRLYRNKGGGRFERAARAGGLEDGSWSVAAAFLDANADGRLDVYIGNYLKTDYANEQKYPMFQVRTPEDYEATDNALYLQEADGGFRDATASSGTAQPGGKTLGACAFDADGDGIGDLFVANDRTENAFFRGRGDGTFEDASASSGIEEIAGRTGPRAGMGVGVGDVDGDGAIDVLVTNFGGEPVTLYRSAGPAQFEDATDRSGLAPGTDPYVQWGTQFEDYDNDGQLDLSIVSGHLVPRVLTTLAGLFRKGGAGPYAKGTHAYRQPILVYRGLGEGRFRDVTSLSGDLAKIRISGRGSAAADFDGDGRLDLAVAAVSGGVRVLGNETPRAGHAIELLPLPARSRSAGPASVVGTRVAVTWSGRRQVREFLVVPSYASGSWVPLHFGLGEAAFVDSIEVFPSGATRPSATYGRVEADALYVLESGGPRRIRGFRTSPR